MHPDIPLNPEDAAYVASLVGVRDKLVQAHAAVNPDLMPTWVVHGPNNIEFPGHHVARLCTALPSFVPTAIVVKAVHLDEIRAVLPPGLLHFARKDEDAPSIVETWI